MPPDLGDPPEGLLGQTIWDGETSILNLRHAHSVQDVAAFLEIPSDKFFYIVQNADGPFYYKRFNIPKKRGGHRLISAPKKGLGIAQTRLAAELEKLYKPKPFVRGYVKGQSFLTNAKYHERQKWVLNIDIEDFYPSITFPRVRGLFMSSYFGFNDRVATILARITTTKDGLPQGARTSPILANLISYTLDAHLIRLANELRLKYSRYADDITFSSSRREVPASLVQSWEPKFGPREIVLGRKLLDAFQHGGFSVNASKTRLAFSYESQIVTGLVVNRTANVSRSDISRLRMVMHSARVHGAEQAAKVWIGPSASASGFWSHVHGWLGHLRQVRGTSDPVVAKLCKLAVAAGSAGPDWIFRSADMVREFDVFLSHASEDKPRLKKLKDRLESIGVTVFWDEDSIRWGESITEKINQGLLKSSFFIPFLTESFGRKGWTNKELNSAIAMNVNRKGRILPIKDLPFSIDENYPLLNETVYRVWPDSATEDTFVVELADEILSVVEGEKEKPNDLG